MKQQVTRNGLVKIPTITTLLVLAFIALLPFSPAARQARRLTIAREYADLIRPEIKGDRRFAHITIGAYTGDGGVLWVAGVVASTNDLARLQQLIANANPPLETKWSVEVMGSPPDE